MLDYCSIQSEQDDDEQSCSLEFCILKLGAAVLEVALLDIQNNFERDQALKWLFNDNDEYIFSFRSICQLLNISPWQIRRSVKSFLEKNRA